MAESLLLKRTSSVKLSPVKTWQKKKKDIVLMGFNLKSPITTAADDIHKYFLMVFREIRLAVSSESSARQRIHLKHQTLFP